MSIKAQMKVADRLSAGWVVMIGDDELALGKATMRDMTTKRQFLVELDDIERVVRGEIF
jgi:histidyl-tRNA synthetase